MDVESIQKQIAQLFNHDEIVDLKIGSVTMEARAPSRGSLTPRNSFKVNFFAKLAKGGIVSGNLEIESLSFSIQSKEDKIREILKKKKEKPVDFTEELKKL